MKIALLGDIALYGRYSVEGNSHVCDYFAAAAEHLAGFDHVVGNLETPFASGMRPRGSKSAYIMARDENVEILRHLHVDVVNLANNHVFDYGAPGYRHTLDVLRRAGIPYFGVEGIQHTLESADARVALHGYCSHNTNPLGMSPRGINTLNLPAVERAMRANHARGFLNVVSIHSGQEHVNQPSREDIRMARQLAGVCPYVYYGHHPHVLQGVEWWKGSLIAYSLGNFCFDDVYTSKSSRPLVEQTENNRGGLILELTVEGDRVVEHRATPIFLDRDAMVVGAQAVGDRLERHSAELAEAEPGYTARRNARIGEFLAGRKQMRNLEWYLKRLNPTSAGIIARARYNARQYRRNVLRHLRPDGAEGQ
ncbi:MAG TPA: CapA family protein [Longimicrobiaceae bacterium]|nr:CapA family protein [Longimicrobiaceae bacterium]